MSESDVVSVPRPTAVGGHEADWRPIFATAADFTPATNRRLLGLTLHPLARMAGLVPGPICQPAIRSFLAATVDDHEQRARFW
ncbi:MAG: hypothetical protein WBM50_11715 [Acidimicrobiales bacterium]